MASIVRSVVVSRPAEQVWAVLEDVRRLPEFSPSTLEVRNAPPRLTREGETFCQVVEVLGRRFESTWTVTELDPGRRLGIEGSVGYGVCYRLVESLEQTGPGRSRVTLEIDYDLPFGLVGRLARRLGVERRAEREAGRVLDGLRELVERADASGPGTGPTARQSPFAAAAASTAAKTDAVTASTGRLPSTRASTPRSR